MKEERKRLVNYFLLITLVFSAVIFSVQFVSADPIFDPIKDMFANWEGGNLSANIAKYFLWAILGILIYSILDVIPFTQGENKGFVRGILAVLISFLAIAYLTPSDIYLTLVSYSAMGFVLAAAIPFAIMLFFSIQIARDGGVGGKVFVKIMWFVFIAFLIYKAIAGAVEGVIETWQTVGYIIVIVASVAWVAFLQRQVSKTWFKEEIDSYRELSRKAGAKTEIDAKTLEKVSRGRDVPGGW